MKSQNKRAEIQFFDRFDKKGGYDVLDGSGYSKILDFMKGKLKKKNGMTIVDMGCGSGAFTSHLAKEFPESNIVGLDISRGCIRRAKKELQDLVFVVDDVEKTKIKDDSVDIVWYSGILHHFADFSKVAKEAFRILKPGGIVFSYDPNFYNPAFWLYRHPLSPFYSKVGITSNERLLKAPEVKRVFENAGFKMKVQAISGIKFRYVESKRTRPLLAVYNVFDKILGITPFAYYLGAFLVGYGKKKS